MPTKPTESLAAIGDRFPIRFQLRDQRDYEIWATEITNPGIGGQRRVLVPTRKDLRLRIWDRHGDLIVKDRVIAEPGDWVIGQLDNPMSHGPTPHDPMPHGPADGLQAGED